MSTNRVCTLAAGLVACFSISGSLAACSNSTSIGSGGSSTTAPTAAATTTVPATVAPATVVDAVAPPTAPPTPACSDTTAPSGNEASLRYVEGDWNGDGTVDNGFSWSVELAGGGVSWFIRAEVNGGESSTVALGDLGAGFAEVKLAVDVDYSGGAEPVGGRDELLAVVGAGASSWNMGIFGVGTDGCLFQYDDGAGAPFIVSIGATVRESSGLLCTGEFLVVLKASTLDDLNWDTAEHRIERSGDFSLVLGFAQPRSPLLAGDTFLDMYRSVGCGGMNQFP